jgi:hypothetical protein
MDRTVIPEMKYSTCQLYKIQFNLKHDLLALLMGYHLDVVGGPSTPHDPESDGGGSLISWQSHPSR